MTGGVIARKTKCHGQDRAEILIIKLCITQTHPLAQAPARAVIEWSARVMNTQARRLACDQYFRLWRSPYHRARLMA
jgi:hypothetical protein